MRGCYVHLNKLQKNSTQIFVTFFPGCIPNPTTDMYILPAQIIAKLEVHV